jgi:hypothetical protein
MKDAVIAAAEEMGAIPRKDRKKLADRGDPENPLRGYFKIMAVDNPKSFASILGRVLPMHVVISQRQDYYTDEEAFARMLECPRNRVYFSFFVASLVKAST